MIFMPKIMLNCFCMLLLVSTARPNTNWIVSMPFHEGDGVSYANGRFILHSPSLEAGYQSKDGLIWANFRDTGLVVYHSADRVVFLEGRFHGFSRSPTSAYNISSDGMHWTNQPLPVPCSFADMTWGQGMFVGVSNCTDSLVATSPDGIIWTRHNTGSHYMWDRVCYGNGMYVAMNFQGAISSSSDGSEWKLVQGNYRSGGRMRNCEMRFGNGRFVIVGNDGRILTSTDGLVWKESTPLDMSETYASMTFEEGQFIVMGNRSGAFRSHDGLAWTGNSGYNYGLPSLAYGNGRYLAISASGTAYSDDSAATWKLSKARKQLFLSGAAYTGGDFIVVSEYGAIATSPDGLSWTERDAGVTTGLAGVVWGNNRAIVFGFGGTILTSTDLEEWSNLIDPRLNFGSMVFGSSVFVGLTTTGKLFASSDGLVWDSVYAAPAGQKLGKIAYGNGTFLVGDATNAGTLLRSTDGHRWTRIHNDAILKTLGGFIVYGKDGFLISEGFGAKDTLYRTTDGSDVRPIKVSVPPEFASSLFLGSMEYGQGYYMTTETSGTDGVVVYSADGIDWKVDRSDRLIAHSLVFGGGKILRLSNSYNLVSVTSQFDPIDTSVPITRRQNVHHNRGKRGNAILDLAGRKLHRRAHPAQRIFVVPNR